MKSKGYRKVEIIDNKPLENQSSIFNYINEKKNYIILVIVLLILIAIYFSFFSFFTHENENENENEIKQKNLKETKDINTDTTSDTSNEVFEMKDLNKKSKILTEKIQQYEKTLRKITIEEIEAFRTINTNGILYDWNKYTRPENPDITVVTTLRNQAHCIQKAIRSVQNQSLKNLEMIIIDDCSLDNSTAVVEKYSKDDGRIILIKHDMNEGIMVTRTEAIRMARGKYITILDADDTFIHKDILEYSLHVANLANLDIVEFYSALFKANKLQGYYHFHGNIPIIYQPELKTKFIVFNEEENLRPIKCRTVWSKLIRNEVLQKTLDNIPDKYLNDYLLGFEDTMVTFSLYEVAKSFYNLRQVGHFYSLDEKSRKFPASNNKTCHRKGQLVTGIDHIKFLQYLSEKLGNNEFDHKILYHEIKSINNFTYSNFKRTITHHFDWAYKIFDGLIESKYLTEKQKKHLQTIKSEIMENEKNLTAKKKI